MPTSPDTAQIVAVIDKQLLARIDEMADALDWSRSAMIYDLLRVAVREHEQGIMLIAAANRTKKAVLHRFRSLYEVFGELARADHDEYNEYEAH